jgi:uncharacterized protein DUF6515
MILGLGSSSFAQRQNHKSKKPTTKHHIRQNHRIQHLPKGYKTFRHNRHDYHYHHGVFYQKHHKEYRRVHAPLGYHLTILPNGFTSFRLRNMLYYHYYGTYYIYDKAEMVYVVVEEPANIDNESDTSDISTTSLPLNSEFDVIQMVDGSNVEGYYLGGNDGFLLFQAGGDTLKIPLSDVISVNIAPQLEDVE